MTARYPRPLPAPYRSPSRRALRPQRIRRTSQALAIRYGLTEALRAARRSRGAGPMPFAPDPRDELLDGRLARALDRWRGAYLAAYTRAWLRARRAMRKDPDLADPRIAPPLRRLLAPYSAGS